MKRIHRPSPCLVGLLAAAGIVCTASGQTSEERNRPSGGSSSSASSSSSTTSTNGKKTSESSSSTTKTLADGSTQTIVTTEKDGVVNTRVVTISPTGQVSVTEQGGSTRPNPAPAAPAAPATPAAPAGGWLGIAVGELSEVVRAQLDIPEGRGVVISAVAPDSPAKKAGLEANDIVLEVDGQPVEGVEKFRRHLGRAKVGQRVDFSLLRRGQKQTAGAVLATPPAGKDATVTKPADPAATERKATVIQADGSKSVVEGLDAATDPFKQLLDDPNVPETMKEQLRRTQEEFRRVQPAAPTPAAPAKKAEPAEEGGMI